jgi:hypothetical protein
MRRREFIVGLGGAGGNNPNQIQALAEGAGRFPTRRDRDSRGPGERCRPTGDADDPDRLYERGRPRSQRHRRAARPLERERSIASHAVFSSISGET